MGEGDVGQLTETDKPPISYFILGPSLITFLNYNQKITNLKPPAKCAIFMYIYLCSVIC